MKNLTITLLLLSPIFIYAQDWQLFPQGQRNYYKQFTIEEENGGEQYDAVYSVKLNYSEIIGGQTQLHFAKIGDLSQDCIDSFFDGEYVSVFPKYFYNVRDLVYLNGETIYTSEIPETNGSFLLKNNAQVGDSWTTVNGSVNIACTATGMMDIYGEMDDTKTFVIQSGDYAGQEIILSKSHGLIKFIPFYAFFDIFKIHEPFEMIGIETDTETKGIILPYYDAYFPFGPGDRAYYRNAYQHIEGSTYMHDVSYRIDSFLTVTPTDTSVNFTFVNISTDENFNYIATSPIRSGQYLKHTGYENIRSSNWFESKPYFIEKMGDIKLSYDGMDTVFTMNYQRETVETSEVGCADGFEYILDIITSTTYSTQYGFLYFTDESWEIHDTTEYIGSDIGGVIDGTTFTVDTKDIVLAADAIYPNPASDKIFVKLDDLVSKHYNLYNLLGQSVIQNKFSNTAIDVQDLPRGVYFLKIDGYAAVKVVLE